MDAISASAQHEALRHRRYLIVALGLCLLAVFVSGVILSRHTSQISASGRAPGTIALASATLLVYVFAVLRKPGSKTDDLQARSLGLKWGVAAGCLWITLLIASSGWISVPILPIVVGAVSAIRIGNVRGGTIAGFWCGVAGGLLGFVAFALAGDILTLGSPHVDNELAGFGYFTVLMLYGLIYCPVAGTLGGLIGILLERTGRPSSKVHAALSRLNDMKAIDYFLDAIPLVMLAMVALGLLGMFLAE